MSTPQDKERALDILAKSVFRELKTNGYSRAEIMSFASGLLELLADDVRAPADAAQHPESAA